MLQNLQSVNIFAPTVTEILLNIVVSLICSFIAAQVYRYTYNGPGYSEGFVNSIVFLSVITSFVIMIIGNNLARAFGLVGALSIIRFRTAIKDTIDIVYIFLGLSIGMAAGVGYYKLAIIGTVLISAILIVFTKTKISLFMSNQYMLQFQYSNGSPDVPAFNEVLKKYCISYESLNVRSIEIENVLEFSFYIRIKKSIDTTELIHELQKVKGLKNINLFFDQQNS